MDNNEMDNDMAQVLVVDDNKDSRTLHLFALNEAGIEAEGCSSGAEALTLLEEDTHIEAVLLDLSMPVMDGLTVAEEIRRNESLHPEKEPVHLAFLTGRDIDDPIARVAARTHVEQIIDKDGDIEGFPDKVKRLLK